MRKGVRYRRAFVGRTYQTGGKEPGMHMIAWRFVQIAIEGSVQMGRKEEIAVGWQIEEDMIPADPTMIEARAQLKWPGRQWNDGDYGRRAADRRHAERMPPSVLTENGRHA